MHSKPRRKPLTELDSAPVAKEVRFKAKKGHDNGGKRDGDAEGQEAGGRKQASQAPSGWEKSRERRLDTETESGKRKRQDVSTGSTGIRKAKASTRIKTVGGITETRPKPFDPSTSRFLTYERPRAGGSFSKPKV